MKLIESLMVLTILGCGVYSFMQENLELFLMSIFCHFVIKYIRKELKEDHTQRA